MSLVNTTGPAPAPPFNQALAGESNLGRILGVQTTVLALGLIVVSARVYARIFVVKAFGKDDACMVLAAVCAPAPPPPPLGSIWIANGISP